MKRPCREKADGAHVRWDTGSSDENSAFWKPTLNELYKTYGQVREQELEGHSRFIENAFGAQQYSEAWIVVNEMTGHKRAKEGQVSGNSPEGRLDTWFTHFKKLSGETPESRIQTRRYQTSFRI